jgi:hypothetical protein
LHLTSAASAAAGSSPTEAEEAAAAGWWISKAGWWILKEGGPNLESGKETDHCLIRPVIEDPRVLISSQAEGQVAEIENDF